MKILSFSNKWTHTLCILVYVGHILSFKVTIMRIENNIKGYLIETMKIKLRQYLSLLKSLNLMPQILSVLQ